MGLLQEIRHNLQKLCRRFVFNDHKADIPALEKIISAIILQVGTRPCMIQPDTRNGKKDFDSLLAKNAVPQFNSIRVH